MSARLWNRIRRAALSVPAFVQHVPKLERELAGLKAHLARLDEENRQLAADLATVGEERESLREHVRRMREELKHVTARPGSYGSPVVDPTLAEVRGAVERQGRWEWHGAPLAIDEAAMLALLQRLARHYPDVRFPESRSAGWRYWFDNPAFSYADAITLFAMMREFEPRRIVEAGAGFSSCVMMDTNDRHFGGAIDLTFLDPYPQVLLSLLAEDAPYRARLLTQPLQEAPIELFTRLEANDILFIDSSHIAKTGSDVNDYFFRILPALRPGVLVHIHDILYPLEYPAAWVLEDKRCWNEAYLLRAFLQGNGEFEVIFFNDWIYNAHGELTERLMPLCRRQTGGSIWLRRVVH